MAPCHTMSTRRCYWCTGILYCLFTGRAKPPPSTPPLRHPQQPFRSWMEFRLWSLQNKRSSRPANVTTTTVRPRPCAARASTNSNFRLRL
eukprot:4013451-Pyramimonas_sp.AAC.1